MDGLNLNNPIYLGMNNLVIVTEILKHGTISAKDARLVSQHWNEVILSFPQPKLRLVLNAPISPCCDFSMPPKLARSIKLEQTQCRYFSGPTQLSVVNKAHLRTTSISAQRDKLRHVGETFGVNIQEICGAVEEDMLPTLYDILQNPCHKVRLIHLRWFAPVLEDLNVPTPSCLPPRNSLTSLHLDVIDIKSKSRINEFLQVVINASPNLKALTINCNLSPDLSPSTKLKSFIIECNPKSLQLVNNFRLNEFSRMLSQVAGNLESLDIGGGGYSLNPSAYIMTAPHTGRYLNWPPMPNLKYFRNEWVDCYPCKNLMQQFTSGNVPDLKTLILGEDSNTSNLDALLAPRFWKEDYFCKVTNLVLIGLRGFTTISSLSVRFPHLKKLEISAFHCRYNTSPLSIIPIDLNTTLQECISLGLQKLIVNICIGEIPRYISDFNNCLLRSAELFKTLKILELGCSPPFELDTSAIPRQPRGHMQDDLTPRKVFRMKKYLKLMQGMDKWLLVYQSGSTNQNLIRFWHSLLKMKFLFNSKTHFAIQLWRIQSRIFLVV